MWSGKQSEEDFCPASVLWVLWSICLVYSCVLNLTCYSISFTLLHKKTTNAVLEFSEVLVTPSDTGRYSPVQECSGERTSELLD